MKTRIRYYWVVTFINSSGDEKSVIIWNEKLQSPRLFKSPTAAVEFLKKSGFADNRLLGEYKCVLCEVEV